MLPHEPFREMRADKTRAARNEKVHGTPFMVRSEVRHKPLDTNRRGSADCNFFVNN